MVDYVFTENFLAQPQFQANKEHRAARPAFNKLNGSTRLADGRRSGGTIYMEDPADLENLYKMVIEDFDHENAPFLSVNCPEIYMMFLDIDQKGFLEESDRMLIVRTAQEALLEFFPGVSAKRKKHLMRAVVFVAVDKKRTKEGTHVYFPELRVTREMACRMVAWVTHRLECRTPTLAAQITNDPEVHRNGNLRMPYTDKLVPCPECRQLREEGKASTAPPGESRCRRCNRQRVRAGRPYTLYRMLHGDGSECNNIDAWRKYRHKLLKLVNIRVDQSLGVSEGYVPVAGSALPQEDLPRTNRHRRSRAQQTKFERRPDLQGVMQEMVRTLEVPTPQGVERVYRHCRVSHVYKSRSAEEYEVYVDGPHSLYCPHKKHYHKTGAAYFFVCMKGVHVRCGSSSTVRRSDGRTCYQWKRTIKRPFLPLTPALQRLFFGELDIGMADDTPEPVSGSMAALMFRGTTAGGAPAQEQVGHAQRALGTGAKHWE